MISSVVIPSATIATTVATGIRMPRMQGTPPITSGSVVIRSKVTNAVFRAGNQLARKAGTGVAQSRRLGVSVPERWR